jgi:hypothetical protein
MCWQSNELWRMCSLSLRLISLYRCKYAVLAVLFRAYRATPSSTLQQMLRGECVFTSSHERQELAIPVSIHRVAVYHAKWVG